MINECMRCFGLYRYLWLMLLAVVAPQTQAATDTVNLRLIAGIASIDTDYNFSGQEKQGQNAFVQIMQYIPEGPFPHAWGLEVGHFSVLNTDVGDLDYDTVSLFVESTPFKSISWLRASIGTSGYFGHGLSENKAFGYRAGIGAEVPINNRFSVLCFFRNDSIFDEEKTTIYSLQVGMQLRLK
jgi:hypothetical protein